ncbi:hypothetical protein NDU88_007237 [Pleurodeles waltl]|uniref:Uncharacterized protein n=1 Tax=Pleurodeles waltl TaxID=8319 RepID=A0AAV7UPW7_PLEWA|nr:hypothetical protein NDU88_007237 [Pleurodeles waltl]
MLPALETASGFRSLTLYGGPRVSAAHLFTAGLTVVIPLRCSAAPAGPAAFGRRCRLSPEAVRVVGGEVKEGLLPFSRYVRSIAVENQAAAIFFFPAAESHAAFRLEKALAYAPLGRNTCWLA